MATASELVKLKNDWESSKTARIRAELSVKKAKEILAQKYDCTTIEEARAKLSELQKRAEEKEQAVVKAYEAFYAEFSDFLE